MYRALLRCRLILWASACSHPEHAEKYDERFFKESLVIHGFVFLTLTLSLTENVILNIGIWH